MNYLALVLLLIYTQAFCQKSFDLTNREIISDSDLLKTTVWIIAFDNNGRVLGTGYFYFDAKKSRLYIITNNHVIGNRSRLSFSLKQKESDNLFFGIDSLQKRCLRFQSNIDLVAVRIDNIPYLNLYDFPYFKVFTEKNIISESQIRDLDLFEENIVTLSYVGISMMQSRGVPLIIKSTLASPYSLEFNGVPEFCINANLGHGNSGSPIVLIKKMNSVKQYLLLGTYYYTFGEHQNVSSVTKDTLKTFFNLIFNMPIDEVDDLAFEVQYGVGIAIKARTLLDLINQ